MKLLPLQRRFLSDANFDAELSVSDIARKLRSTAPRVQYILQRMLQCGILQISPLINRTALGLTDYHILFSIAARPGAQLLAFLGDLIKAPGVVFLAEMAGDFQYTLIIAAASPHEAATRLDTLTSQHDIRLQAKTIAAGFQYRLYPKRYLRQNEAAPKTAVKKGRKEASSLPFLNPLKPFAKKDGPFPVQLDETDEALLRLLSLKAQSSLRELGAQLALSHSGVRHRIEKLRQAHIFLGLYFDVEPLSYGYHDYILQFSVTNRRAELEQRLFAVADRFPAISYAASYFGSWDFELGLEVNLPEQIVAVSQEVCELLGPEYDTVRLMNRFRQRVLRPYPF